MMRNSLIAACLAVSLVIGPAPDARAQGDSSFTYQGELTFGGAPAQGAHDMAFSVWDAESGGNRVGSRIEVAGVEVVDGRFTVRLELGGWVFGNARRWLEVEVEGFTLDPRTRITSSPFALQTRGLFVDELLNVGIGTDTPITRLHVQDGSAGNVFPFPSVSAAFERSSTNYLHILSPSNTERGIVFGDPQSAVNGGVVFDSSRAPDGLVFRTGGNVDRMRINWLGDTIVHQKLGVGDPTNLPGQVTIKDSGHNALFAISADSSRSDYPTIFASNSAGPSVWAWGNSDATLSGGGDVVVGADTGPNLAIDRNSIMARDGGQAAGLDLNAEGGDINLGAYGIHPAFAYGFVGEAGILRSSSANVTGVQRTSVGNYLIHVEGGARTGDVAIATIADRVAVIGIRVQNSAYDVYLRGNNSGDPIDGDFQFVIYRP
jgi:hypothetical protein